MDQLAATLGAMLEADGTGRRAVDPVSGRDETALWDAVASARRPSRPPLSCRVVTRPRQFSDFHHWATVAADEAGAGLSVTSDPCIGVHDVRFTGPLDPALDALARLRRSLAGIGGTAVVRAVPRSVEGAVVWGPPPAAAAVMATVKRALDPGSTFAPGRFSPWW